MKWKPQQLATNVWLFARLACGGKNKGLLFTATKGATRILALTATRCIILVKVSHFQEKRLLQSLNLFVSINTTREQEVWVPVHVLLLFVMLFAKWISPKNVKIPWNEFHMFVFCIFLLTGATWTCPQNACNGNNPIHPFFFIALFLRTLMSCSLSQLTSKNTHVLYREISSYTHIHTCEQFRAGVD